MKTTGIKLLILEHAEQSPAATGWCRCPVCTVSSTPIPASPETSPHGCT